jgi:hypothetical protein
MNYKDKEKTCQQIAELVQRKVGAKANNATPTECKVGTVHEEAIPPKYKEDTAHEEAAVHQGNETGNFS